MAEPNDSSLAFFTKGTPRQWQFVYELRKDAIRVKADQRCSKKGGPEEFIKLDTWFREKLPKLIHSRKDPHVIYEELVQIAKWRLMMGKYRPKMLDLVRINTETSCRNISRKALKKLSAQKNLQQAITQLVNLKGIGPSTASAILAAAYPDEAPFMSDEGMLSTPGVEATDSTIAEYNNYSEQLRNKSQSLRELDPDYEWTPHKVDQALWIYYLVRDLKPQLLESLPLPSEKVAVSASRVSTTAGSTGVEHADDNAVGAHDDLLASNNHSHRAEELPEEATSTNSSDKNINSNGAFDDNSFASVPYSEEEDLSQGASCSSLVNSNALVEVAGDADTTADSGYLHPLEQHSSTAIILNSSNSLEQLGGHEPQLLLPDSVSSNALLINNHAPTTTDHSVAALLTNGRTNGAENCSTNDVVTTSSNSSSGVVTGGEEEEEDSKDDFAGPIVEDDSQDSLGEFAASTTGNNHQQQDETSGEAVTNNLVMVGSAENSTDAISTTTTNGTSLQLHEHVLEEDPDSQPPLKKQKTQLELCPALAATVDGDL